MIFKIDSTEAIDMFTIGNCQLVTTALPRAVKEFEDCAQSKLPLWTLGVNC